MTQLFQDIDTFDCMPFVTLIICIGISHCTIGFGVNYQCNLQNILTEDIPIFNLFFKISNISNIPGKFSKKY